jgi:hypothetical protein
MRVNWTVPAETTNWTIMCTHEQALAALLMRKEGEAGCTVSWWVYTGHAHARHWQHSRGHVARTKNKHVDRCEVTRTVQHPLTAGIDQSIICQNQSIPTAQLCPCQVSVHRSSLY